MKHSDIAERCRAYIEDWGETNPGYALMITGEWGCGKTFLVRNIIDDRNKNGGRLAWYISLFGVKKVEDIDDKMFEAAHPILGDSKNKKWYSVGYSVLKGAAKHKYGIDVGNITEPILKLFTDEGESPSGCQVLFVDDVERTSIDINDILGYFNPIVEGNTRVIFVSNEREIKSNEYGIIKEKSIGETYEVEPDYKKALETFWNENMTQSRFASENIKKQLLSITGILEVQNLRIIRQVIHNWKMFYSQLLDDYQKDDEFIEKLFEEYVVLSICLKKPQLSKMRKDQEAHDSVVDYANLSHDELVSQMKGFWNFYNKKKMDEKHSVSGEVDIARSFKTGSISYPLRYAELWPYILMKGKDADGDWLQEKMHNSYNEHQELIQHRKDAQRSIERLRMLTFYQSDSQGVDIKAIFERTVSEFDDGHYTRFDEIIQYVQMYLTLMHGDVLPNEYTYKFLANQLSNFIEKHREKISALPEFERVQRERVMRVENAEVQKCLDEIFDIAKEMTGTSEKQIVGDKKKFLEFISDANRAVTDFVNIPFLKQVNIDKVFEWLGDNLDAHRHFLRFLEYRYRKDFGNDQLHETDYEDFPYVNAIYEKYRNRCNELKHSFRLDVRDYIELKNKYGELINYMEKIICGSNN